MLFRQPFQGDYPITQKYGDTYTDPKGHTGIDYACPEGTPVYASADGIVMRAGWDNTGYGNVVIIMHNATTATLYAQQIRLRDLAAQKVKQGQVIGHSGNTENSTGPHLHFEARHVWNNYKSDFDPMELPLMSFADAPESPIPADLKGADNFKSGDLVKVVCTNGVKAFYDTSFTGYTVYPQGFPFYYTGEETVRKSNGLTYMRVVPANFSVWVAVNDRDVQILDKE